MTTPARKNKMNYTDTQLKAALAKILPEQINHLNHLYWIGDEFDIRVLDTELLHVCWLVENTLRRDEFREYAQTLHPKYIDHLSADCCVMHSSWQQRAIALAKVKGIER